MEEKECSRTKNNIIVHAKKEFLSKGYSQASLRSICKSSGVTTGAFYFSFQGKEDLLRTIVQPVIDEAKTTMPELLQREINAPDSATENDSYIMEFELKHKDEILILMEKVDGSCYETFSQKFTQMLETAFLSYYKNQLGYEPNRDLIHILVSMRIQSNLSILKGDYDMKYSLELNRAIGIHADGGTEKLISYIKRNVQF